MKGRWTKRNPSRVPAPAPVWSEVAPAPAVPAKNPAVRRAVPGSAAGPDRLGQVRQVHQRVRGVLPERARAAQAQAHEEAVRDPSFASSEGEGGRRRVPLGGARTHASATRRVPKTNSRNKKVEVRRRLGRRVRIVTPPSPLYLPSSRRPSPPSPRPSSSGRTSRPT